MTDNTNISKTRRGYFYQDKFALLEILTYFKKDLRKVYVDIQYGSGKKSLDIKLILANGKELVYEIKTGENFKNNEKKTLEEAVLSLFKYQRGNKSNTKIILVIDPEMRSAVARFWSDLLSIQDVRDPVRSQKRKKSRKKTIQSFFVDFGFKELNVTEEEFIDFICKVKFVLGPYNESDGNSNSELDDKIETKIAKIAESFSVKDNGRVHVQDCSIKAELLELVQISAGNKNLDLKKIIASKLAKCFARRRVLSKIPSEGNLEEEIKTETKKIEEELFESSSENIIGAADAGLEIIS